MQILEVIAQRKFFSRPHIYGLCKSKWGFVLIADILVHQHAKNCYSRAIHLKFIRKKEYTIGVLWRVYREQSRRCLHIFISLALPLAE